MMMDARTDRHAHLDLLDQVADSEAERLEVRRILGELAAQDDAALLAEHELDTHIRHVRAAVYPIRYRACANGPCAQGRKLCPTPQACQVSTEPADGIADEADAPRPPMRRGDAPRLILLGLASWAAVAGALYAMGVRL